MIITKETTIDLGGIEIKVNLIANNEEILMASLDTAETPVWVELWPAAIGLARWLWQGNTLIDLSVLELGAGLGLPGVVAALKKSQVIQTDYIPEALTVAKNTAQINQVTGISQKVADWRSFDIDSCFDVIMGSDITYHPELNPYLEQIFLNNLAPGGKVIIADSGRLETEKFIDHLYQTGWKYEIATLPVAMDKFNYNVKIYQLSRRSD